VNQRTAIVPIHLPVLHFPLSPSFISSSPNPPFTPFLLPLPDLSLRPSLLPSGCVSASVAPQFPPELLSGRQQREDIRGICSGRDAALCDKVRVGERERERESERERGWVSGRLSTWPGESGEDGSCFASLCAVLLGFVLLLFDD
jgi:hypothetical protein